MSKKTQVIIIILVALIFFGLGYAFSLFKNKGAVDNNNTYQAGWDAAKARLAESGLVQQENAEVRQLFGEITAINDNKISLKIRSALDPLADQSLDTRTVIVDPATKIYSLKMKSLKEYAAELTAYNKLAKDKRPVALPENFNKSEISISDLKVGQTISVKAEKDIKAIKEFNVIEINYTEPEVSPTGTAL